MSHSESTAFSAVRCVTTRSHFHVFSLCPYTAPMYALKLRVTDSVELRQITEEDAEPLTLLIERNRSHLKEWLPWLDSSTCIEDTARFIGRSIEQANDE